LVATSDFMRILNYQAVYVMWLRQMKRFIRDKGRLLSSIIQPFFFLSVLGLGLGSARFPGMPTGIEYIDIITPGIITMSILFPSVFVGVSVLWDKQFGFLQEVLVAPVSRLSIVVGRTLGGATTALIQGLIVLIISTFLGVSFNLSPALLLAFVFMSLISFIAIGFGLIIASKLETIEAFQFIVSLFIFPLLFLSSPFSPIDSLPSWLKTIAFINPITYGVDGLRASLINYSYFPLYIDLGVLLALSIIMMFLGSYFFSRSEV